MKIMKNRLLISFVCILLAGALMFIYSASVKSESAKTQVVTVTSIIKKGDIITSKMVDTKTVGGYNISKTLVKETADVVGKYALADLYVDDYILIDKVAEKLPNANEKLLKLDGNRFAISVMLKEFSRGLSDKIISGDIVSCLVTTEQGTDTPSSLTYLEVLTTTTGEGFDKEKASDKTEENLATITLLATPEQAKLLADYDKKAELHFALVYRGDDETAQTFIKKQANFSTQQSGMGVVPNVKTNSDNRK